jgi:hypothetical protein
MASIWVEALIASFEQALDMLAVSVGDCPSELWERPMWPVEAPGPGFHFLKPDWQPVTDPQERAQLSKAWVERRSTPWSVAWHALETFDYDLSGEFVPWMPPPPFLAHPHWRDLPRLPAAWTREQLMGYIRYCRQRVTDTLSDLSEEQAARPLPQTHRYKGQPYAKLIMGMVGHTTEHAAQIQQFFSGAATTS